MPRAVLPDLLPKDAPSGRNIVLGAGKAAAEMAAVANECVQGAAEGLVATRHGHGTMSPCGGIEVIEAGHPVPDQQSFVAAERMLGRAASAEAGDRVLFMFSGGGSALLSAPINGVTPEDKQQVTQFLLRSGARINEINCVRKHLSRIKGGALAHQAAKAELMTFVISDVVGNDPSDVASGPSIPYSRNADNAIEILEHYNYSETSRLAAAIRSADAVSAPDHSVFVAATATRALDSVASELERSSWRPVRIGDDVEGNATEVGRTHAELAIRHLRDGERVALISGGELTVEVSNPDGRGGPNLEYLAGLMLRLDGAVGIEAVACDSDGIDGSMDNAGGYVDSTSLARAEQNGLSVADLLRENRSYDLFESLNDLIVTGPTRTNVNDIRIILVDPQARTIDGG